MSYQQSGRVSEMSAVFACVRHTGKHGSFRSTGSRHGSKQISSKAESGKPGNSQTGKHGQTWSTGLHSSKRQHFSTGTGSRQADDASHLRNLNTGSQQSDEAENGRPGHHTLRNSSTRSWHTSKSSIHPGTGSWPSDKIDNKKDRASSQNTDTRSHHGQAKTGRHRTSRVADTTHASPPHKSACLKGSRHAFLVWQTQTRSTKPRDLY